MSPDSVIDLLPTEARRELVRFTRDQGIPLWAREMVSVAFAIGYGVGVDQTATKFSGDLKILKEQGLALKQRVEAMP